LGTTAVTSAEAIANASSYISGSAASVAGGTAAHLYAANVAGNSAVVDTLGGIENVTGTAGIDYVVGSAENNVISTLGGNDYISAGAGADTVTGGAGNDEILLGASDASADTVVHGTSTAASAQSIASAGTIAANDTITFGNGVDVVRNFDGTMDKIDVTTNGTFATLIGGNEGDLDELTTYFVSGTYVEATGVFTMLADGTGADTLIFENEGTGANDTLAAMNNGMVLIGVDSDDLSTADLI
jgi:Ca2+-binding RTX toxin-like protein